MNKTSLVFVAVLAASTLIIGTMGALQPAAAWAHKHHKDSVKQSNSIDVNQAIYQIVKCDKSGSNNCNDNYQQAANTAILTNTSQQNER